MTKAAVASWAQGRVAESVLGSCCVRALRKCRALLSKISRRKVFPSRSAGHLVHLAPRQIVKLPADIHAFKLSHATEVLIVFFLRCRREELSKALQLFRRKCQSSIVLAIFQESILDVIFSAYLDEI